MPNCHRYSSDPLGCGRNHELGDLRAGFRPRRRVVYWTGLRSVDRCCRCRLSHLSARFCPGPFPVVCFIMTALGEAVRSIENVEHAAAPSPCRRSCSSSRCRCAREHLPGVRCLLREPLIRSLADVRVNRASRSRRCRSRSAQPRAGCERVGRSSGACLSQVLRGRLLAGRGAGSRPWFGHAASSGCSFDGRSSPRRAPVGAHATAMFCLSATRIASIVYSTARTSSSRRSSRR